MSTWYTSKVFEGMHNGRKIGFPTVNLSYQVFPVSQKQGVYAVRLKYDGKLYQGALFFGPRLVKNETHTVLEIYILDFNQKIYGETVMFTVEKYIRQTMKFETTKQLCMQIKSDIHLIKELLL